MLRVATGILVAARTGALVGKRRKALATAPVGIASTCFAAVTRWAEAGVCCIKSVCAEDEVEDHLPPAISAAVFSEEVWIRFEARVAVSSLLTRVDIRKDTG
jgi:hypothetical protein